MSHIKSPAGIAPRARKRIYYKSYASYVEAPRPAGKHLPCGAATETPVGGGRRNPRVTYSI
jgi:hypothetical protein